MKIAASHRLPATAPCMMNGCRYVLIDQPETAGR